jgi:hypothetical protein
MYDIIILLMNTQMRKYASDATSELLLCLVKLTFEVFLSFQRKSKLSENVGHL